MESINIKNCPSPDKYFSKLYKSISSNDKFAFLSGFVVCLAVNMFVYTNTCFVHDAIRMYDGSDYVNNGRILLSPVLGLLNHMQIPWIIGLVTSVIIGFTVVYLARIFKVSSKLSSVILAGIVVTSDTIVTSHAYFHYVYVYTLSLLLAVMAVYCCDKSKKGLFASVVLLCAGIMLYQAYIATAVCLFVFKLIFELEEDKKLKETVLKILKYVSVTVIAAAVYYLIWKICLTFTDVEVVENYAYDNMGLGSTLTDFMKRILESGYNTLFRLFPFFGENSYPIKFIVSALTVIAFIVFALKQKNVKNILLYFVYILTYVFAVNLMYFLSGRASYELTTFAYILPMLSLLYVIDNNKISKPELRNKVNWAVSVLCIVLIFGQTVYANSMYLKLKVNYDNAWSYATRLVDRLEQTEGFNKNTKVQIISYDYEEERCTFRVTEYERNKNIQYAVNYTSGYKTNNTLHCYMNGITYPETLCWFITQEMDMDIDICGNSQEMIENPEVKNMGVFPSTDSIKWVGDTLVVKIG